MKKSILKLVTAMMMVAMCVMTVPVQDARAESMVSIPKKSNIDTSTMTDEQIEVAYFGRWEGYDGFEIDIHKDTGTFAYYVEEDGEKFCDSIDVVEWTYKGVEIVEHVPQSDYDLEASMAGYTEEIVGKAKALVFETAYGAKYYVYKRYWSYDGNMNLVVECNYADGNYDNCYCVNKAGEGEYIDDTLNLAIEKYPAKDVEVKEDSDKQPEVNMGTGSNEAEAGDKEFTLIKGKRKVYTGETVYTVKKGDCLWKIAREQLGKGPLYKELFKRNKDIIKKAELIYVGQEIIIPVLKK